MHDVSESWSLLEPLPVLKLLDSNVARCAQSKDSCEQLQAHGVQ